MCLYRCQRGGQGTKADSRSHNSGETANPPSARTILSRLLAANDVAFSVLELDEPADGGDFTLGQDDLAPIRHDGGSGLINVIDSHGTFKAGHPLTRDDIMPLLQGAGDAGVLLIARGCQEEAWRTPGGELPLEDLLVEPLGTRDIVRMNGKEGKIARHRQTPEVGSQLAYHSVDVDLRLSLECQSMSKKRQTTKKPDLPPSPEKDVPVRTFAVRYASGYQIPWHAHDWHQLIYASEGVMWVHTAQGDWVVPPNRGVWVPAGVQHSIDMSGKVLVQTLYFAQTASSSFPEQCCAVNVSPLLRELIRHGVALGTLDHTKPAMARLVGVLVDQVNALPTIPLQLPLPTDERAQAACDWLRLHPDDPGLIKQIAKRVGASARTLERLFQQQTGLTFGKWRQQLRLLHALRLLAAGRAVTAVALDVGYESTSAFIAMFKKALGTTPHRYFDK